MMFVHHGGSCCAVIRVWTRVSSATEPAIAGTAFVTFSVCFAVAWVARVFHALRQ
jgi:hypothetical protein